MSWNPLGCFNHLAVSRLQLLNFFNIVNDELFQSPCGEQAATEAEKALGSGTGFQSPCGERAATAFGGKPQFQQQVSITLR